MSFKITQIFGEIENIIVNGVHINQPHTGIDIGMPVGTELFSPAHAVVKGAGVDQYGNKFIRLLMDNGDEVLLLHLNDITVHQGQDIASGTSLGHSGSSGLSTGPHLHFEVDQSGKAVDPFKWLEATAGVNPTGQSYGNLPPNPLAGLQSAGDFFGRVNSAITPQNVWKVGFIGIGLALIGVGVFIYFFKEEAHAAEVAGGTVAGAAAKAA